MPDSPSWRPKDFWSLVSVSRAQVLGSVGTGGQYRTLREPRDHTRSEDIPVWPPAGKTMLEVARQEALGILHTHKPTPLPEDAADQIDVIVAEADRESAPR